MSVMLPPVAPGWHVPPVPAPPHDPSSLLLAGTIGPTARGGWRAADGAAGLLRVEIAAGCPALVLEPTPGAARRLTEASGSFGGLRLPRNVALGSAGEVYLLDLVSGQLKRFDPCACRFEPVPCFLQLAQAPHPCAVSAPARVPLTLLAEPHGIAICGGDLYVADSAHARVVRYSMSGFLPRGALRLPRAQQRRWYPFALAFDGRGRLCVADSRNGCIDIFDAHGRWLQSLATPGGSPVALAFDCRDRLYAVLASAEPVLGSQNDGFGTRWSWPDDTTFSAVAFSPGETARTVAEAASQARDFAAAPLPIDARGQLHLVCAAPCDEGEALFDARGLRLRPEARVREERYLRNGHYRSGALDSQIEGCQWHRVELRGTLPAGCTVQVSTLSAHVELGEAELAALDPAWVKGATATAMDRHGRWDCLVQSPPGRFLWLKLELAGDGLATPALEAVLVEFPRISLRRYLPAVFGAEPVSADFTDRFTAIFDATLRSIERRLDRLAALFDPLSAPAEHKPGGPPDFLSWIASWIGLSLARDWPEQRRRHYIKEAASLYCLRGTRLGLWRQLLLLLGFDQPLCLAVRNPSRCTPVRNCGPEDRKTPADPPPLILEHFKLRRWLHAGRGRLGDDSMLWGRSIVDRSQLDAGARAGASRLDSTPDPLHDPFLVYAHRFSVFVPARLRDSDPDRRALEQLLARETPAHTLCDLRYVEPRFRVGVQAMIGLDSVVARTPSGVSFGKSVLGQGSVLSGPPARRGGPSLRVGNARVGTNTALT